jgi:S-formylglutathione hydrolase FrmB
MALTQIHYWSTSLEKMAMATAIVPQGLPGPFATWYLLHGLSDDHSAWSRRTSIERYAEKLPVIIVMPDGERGWYTDSHANPKGKFESAIVKDLIPWVDATFRTLPSREHRVVSGLSMGGYGAMKLALKHPGLFCAAASHSGALGRGAAKITGRDPWNTELRAVMGGNPRGGPNDLHALAASFKGRLAPRLRIDCGVDDFLVSDNRTFHRLLKRLKVPHEYVERPGAHTWEYWDREIQALIPWFRSALRLPA